MTLGNAVVAKGKRSVVFQEIEVQNPGPWDLLVALETSAISIGTECYTLANIDFQKYAEPTVLGYAPVARVISLGKAIERDTASGSFSVGSRVSYFAPRPAPGLRNGCGGY